MLKVNQNGEVTQTNCEMWPEKAQSSDNGAGAGLVAHGESLLKVIAPDGCSHSTGLSAVGGELDSSHFGSTQ